MAKLKCIYCGKRFIRQIIAPIKNVQWCEKSPSGQHIYQTITKVK